MAGRFRNISKGVSKGAVGVEKPKLPAKEEKPQLHDSQASDQKIQNLIRKVEEFPFYEKAKKRLEMARIVHVYDLAKKSEAQLVIWGFSYKSRAEIKEALAKMDLKLGINLDRETTAKIWGALIEKSRLEEQKQRESNDVDIINLSKRTDGLEFSVRTALCLQNAKISHVFELVQLTEERMLKTLNFGRGSIREVKEILAEMGLTLGMKFDGETISRIKEAANSNH
jgi:DNA-directed RNA polymerase alpha subunit